MSTQEPPEQSTPPSGIPAQQPVPYRQPAAPSAPPVNRMLLLGLVLGLVVGAGGVGLAWGLGGASGANADASAVCGIVSRSPDLPADRRDLSRDLLQRWTLSEVAVSIANADDTYRPLADALLAVTRSFRTLNLDDMREATGRAKQVCADL